MVLNFDPVHPPPGCNLFVRYGQKPEEEVFAVLKIKLERGEGGNGNLKKEKAWSWTKKNPYVLGGAEKNRKARTLKIAGKAWKGEGDC